MMMTRCAAPPFYHSTLISLGPQWILKFARIMTGTLLYFTYLSTVNYDCQNLTLVSLYDKKLSSQLKKTAENHQELFEEDKLPVRFLKISRYLALKN